MNRLFTLRIVTRITGAICVTFYLYCIYNKSTSNGSSSRFKGKDDFCQDNYKFGHDAEEDEDKTRIFFLETSNECCLTFRQACSVESAVRANPNGLVTLYMNSPSPMTLQMTGNKNDLYSQKRDCAITKDLVKNWPNLRLVREDLIQHVKNTPLWTVIEMGLLRQSASPLAQMSDMVRVAMLWKRGGIYLDLDCIVLKSLDGLHNTVGLTEYLVNWIENGVMAFEAHHPFLQFLMSFMLVKYEPRYVLSIGPSAVSAAVQEFCNRGEDEILNDLPMSCRWNVSLMLKSHQAFYALGGNDRQVFFRPASLEESRENFQKLRHSFVSHIYDAEVPKSIPENSLYGLLAKKFCPTTYARAVQEGGF